MPGPEFWRRASALLSVGGTDSAHFLIDRATMQSLLQQNMMQQAMTQNTTQPRVGFGNNNDQNSRCCCNCHHQNRQNGFQNSLNFGQPNSQPGHNPHAFNLPFTAGRSSPVGSEASSVDGFGKRVSHRRGSGHDHLQGGPRQTSTSTSSSESRGRSRQPRRRDAWADDPRNPFTHGAANYYAWLQSTGSGTGRRWTTSAERRAYGDT